MAWIRDRLTYANATATVALFVALGGSAYAAVGGSFVGRNGAINGCVAKNGGALRVLKPGKACPRGTVALPFDQTGRPGANGTTGQPGAPGQSGAPGQPGQPGAPGSALAYAHVKVDGTVDGANSKGVTASDGANSQVANGRYCLTIAATPHTAAVTAEPTSVSTFAIAELNPSGLASIIGAGWCLPGTNVYVATYDGFNNPNNAYASPFYITIN